MAKVSDFDFEELDKAVADVLGTGTDVTGTTNSADATGTTNIYDTDVTTEHSEQPAPQERVAEPAAPASVSLPAARRSSGRFMDVVHPSSDMRTRTAPAVISRNTTQTPTQSPDQASIETSSEAPTELDTTTTNHQPPTTNYQESSLESPFLADAKVDKRPLGSYSSALDTSSPNLATVSSDTQLLNAPKEELKIEAPDEPLLEASYPDPIDFAAHSASLPFEKEDTGEKEYASDKLENTALSDTALDAADIENIEINENIADNDNFIVNNTTSSEDVISGPTSISQQYKEQPVANQSSGAIFDTETYHKPLTVQPKKRSGALTIVWIILLIILGAGAGVAFYLFVLPNL